MPPEIITSAIPITTIQLVAKPIPTERRLRTVKKAGEAKDSTMPRIRIIRIRLISRNSETLLAIPLTVIPIISIPYELMQYTKPQ
jgi:hypothetical protein